MEQTETKEVEVVVENKLKITDNDFAELKQIEHNIAMTQRKIGDIEIRKAAMINEAGEHMQKYKDYQMYLYKKHELDFNKSYQINEQTKEFVLVEK
jgi:hypothetical protein